MLNTALTRELAMHFKVGSKLNEEIADALNRAAEHNDREQKLLEEFFNPESSETAAPAKFRPLGAVPDPMGPTEIDSHPRHRRQERRQPGNYTVKDGKPGSGRYSKQGYKGLVAGRRRRASLERMARRKGISYQEAKAQFAAKAA